MIELTSYETFEEEQYYNVEQMIMLVKQKINISACVNIIQMDEWILCQQKKQVNITMSI